MALRKNDGSSTGLFSAGELDSYGLGNGGGGTLSRRLADEKRKKEEELQNRIANAQSRLSQSGIEPPAPDNSHGVFQSLMDGLNYLGNKKNQGLMALSGGDVADQVTGKDLLTKWAGGDFKGSGVAGFGFDVLTDPLNLLSFVKIPGLALKAGEAGAKALAGGEAGAKALAQGEIKQGLKEVGSAGDPLKDLKGRDTKGTFVERLTGPEGDKLRQIQHETDILAQKHGIPDDQIPHLEQMVAQHHGLDSSQLNDMVYGSGPRQADVVAPKPWELSNYAKSGKVEEVNVDWLSQLKGNPLRYSDKQMESLKNDIQLNGIREPLIVMIGQNNRQVLLGEGNHRLQAAKELGYQHVPVRVMRQQNVDGGLIPVQSTNLIDSMAEHLKALTPRLAPQIKMILSNATGDFNRAASQLERLSSSDIMKTAPEGVQSEIDNLAQALRDKGTGMSKVPKDGYFPGDAKPSDVFDNVPVKPLNGSVDTPPQILNAPSSPVAAEAKPFDTNITEKNGKYVIKTKDDLSMVEVQVNGSSAEIKYAKTDPSVQGQGRYTALVKEVMQKVKDDNPEVKKITGMIVGNEALAFRKKLPSTTVERQNIGSLVAHKVETNIDDFLNVPLKGQKALPVEQPKASPFDGIHEPLGGLDASLRGQVDDIIKGANGDANQAAQAIEDLANTPDIKKASRQMRMQEIGIQGKVAHNLAKYMAGVDDTYKPNEFIDEVYHAMKDSGMSDNAIEKIMDPAITQAQGEARDHAIGHAVDTFGGSSVKASVLLEGDLLRLQSLSETLPQGQLLKVSDHLRRGVQDQGGVENTVNQLLNGMDGAKNPNLLNGMDNGSGVQSTIDQLLHGMDGPPKSAGEVAASREVPNVDPNLMGFLGKDGIETMASTAWAGMRLADRTQKLTSMGLSDSLARSMASNEFKDLPELAKNTLRAEVPHPFGAAHDQIAADIINFPRPHADQPVVPHQFDVPPGDTPPSGLDGLGGLGQPVDKGRWAAQLGGHIPFTNIGGYVKVPGSEALLSGLGNLAGKGIDALGGQLSRIPGLADLGKATKDVLGKNFVAGYGVPGAVHQLTRKTAEMVRMDGRDIVNNMVNVRNGWAKAGYVSSPAVDEAILHALEDPTKMDNLNDVQKGIVDDMRNFFDIHYAKAEDMGLAKEFKENYLPHMFKGPQKDVEDALKVARRRGIRLPNSFGSGLDRMHDIPLSEVLKDPVLKAKLQPETNPIKIMATYKASLEKVIRNDDFLTDFGALGPDVVRRDTYDQYNAATGTWDKIPGHIPSGWVKAPIQQLKGSWVPPEVANHLKDAMEPFINSGSFHSLLKMYDNVLGWWKGMATVPNIGFHARNMTGNVFNNYLAGVRSLDNYILAGEAQKAEDLTMDYFYDLIRHSNNTPEHLQGLGLSNTNQLSTEVGAMDDARSRILERVFNDDRFAEKFFMGGGTKIPVTWQGKTVRMNMTGIKFMSKLHGVTGAGYFGADLGAEVMKRLDPVSTIQKYNPLSTNNVLLKGMEKGGNMIEDNTRLAHFISKLRTDGGDMNKAAESVKKYLFDYSNLTATEKNVMKRLMPFYAFTRNNLPLQVSELVKQPKYASMMATFQNYMDTQSEESTGTPLNRNDLPKFITNLYSVRLPFQVGADKRDVVIGVDMPNREVNTFSFNEIMSMITPVAKVLYEQTANRNFFTGKDIEAYQGETTRAPGYMQGVFKLAQMGGPDDPNANIFNKAFDAMGATVGKDEYGNPELRIGTRAAHLLSQVVSAKNAGKAIDFLSGSTKDPFNSASMLTGVSAISSSENQRRTNSSYDKLSALEDLLRKLKDEGSPVPTTQQLREKDPAYQLQKLLNGR